MCTCFLTPKAHIRIYIHIRLHQALLGAAVRWFPVFLQSLKVNFPMKMYEPSVGGGWP